MSTKKKGILTVSGEWAVHLRPYLKREFWKGERKHSKTHARREAARLGDDDELQAQKTEER